MLIGQEIISKAVGIPFSPWSQGFAQERYHWNLGGKQTWLAEHEKHSNLKLNESKMFIYTGATNNKNQHSTFEILLSNVFISNNLHWKMGVWGGRREKIMHQSHPGNRDIGRLLIYLKHNILSPNLLLVSTHGNTVCISIWEQGRTKTRTRTINR